MRMSTASMPKRPTKPATASHHRRESVDLSTLVTSEPRADPSPRSDNRSRARSLPGARGERQIDHPHRLSRSCPPVSAPLAAGSAVSANDATFEEEGR